MVMCAKFENQVVNSKYANIIMSAPTPSPSFVHFALCDHHWVATMREEYNTLT